MRQKGCIWCCSKDTCALAQAFMWRSGVERRSFKHSACAQGYAAPKHHARMQTVGVFAAHTINFMVDLSSQCKVRGAGKPSGQAPPCWGTTHSLPISQHTHGWGQTCLGMGNLRRAGQRSKTGASTPQAPLKLCPLSQLSQELCKPTPAPAVPPSRSLVETSKSRRSRGMRRPVLPPAAAAAAAFAAAGELRLPGRAPCKGWCKVVAGGGGGTPPLLCSTRSWCTRTSTAS